MGFGNILLSGRFSAPKAIKRACRLVALAALALCFVPGRAAAQACPQGPVTGTYTLTADIVATTGDTMPCITVGGSGTTIVLSGFKIDVSAFGNSGVAINAGAYDNTSIIGNSGAIITAYTNGAGNNAAIEATGGTNLTITGVRIYNELSTSTLLSSLTSLCENPSTPYTGIASTTEYGTGISVSGVTGATIGSNEVCFYQNGISVQVSAIPSNGAGSISGNTLNWNTFNMSGGGPETYSAGLVLSNSSGWSVSGNTIMFDGSISPTGQCVSPSSNTGVNTCSFALQIINGSSANTISPNNSVDSNFIGGIYAGPDASGNTITQNTALSNLGWDLWSDAPAHANTWRKNTCSTAGGTLNSHLCRN